MSSAIPRIPPNPPFEVCPSFPIPINMGECPTTKPQFNHQSEKFPIPAGAAPQTPFSHISIPCTMPPTNHPTLDNFTTSTITNTSISCGNSSSSNSNNNNKNRIRNRSATISVPQPRSHGSSTQACAACKYQRRKCASDCVLAPYFPHDRQRQFLNAHRLFGVSNIIKIVRHLDPMAKDHAMRTIIFQSDARAADPVGGCYRMICDLEERINLANAELEIVLHHLAICRAAAAQQQQQQIMPAPDGGDSAMKGGNLGVYDDGKWRGEYVREDEVVNSWACKIPANANAESTCDSFPQHNNNHLEGCTNDIMPIFEQLTCYDGGVKEEDQFRFDSNGNIVASSNGFLTEEKGVYKDEDDCFSCVEDHNDLKAAATFFSLTNGDDI